MKVNARLLLEELKKIEQKNPEDLDKDLYIEIFENPNPEKGGWETCINSENWKFVKPAWNHGVLFSKTKDKFLIQINY